MRQVFTIHQPNFPSDRRDDYLQALLGKVQERGTPFGGYTIVYSHSQEDFGVTVAVAFCHPNDMYSKKRGRDIAMLLLDAGIPEIDRLTIGTQELAPDMLETNIRPSAFKASFLNMRVAGYVAANLREFQVQMHHPRSIRARLAHQVIDQKPSWTETIVGGPLGRPAYVQEQLDREAALAKPPSWQENGDETLEELTAKRKARWDYRRANGLGRVEAGSIKPPVHIQESNDQEIAPNRSLSSD